MLLTTFSLEDHTNCENCHAHLGLAQLQSNIRGQVQDEQGIPEIIVDCHICHFPNEWPMRAN